MSSLSSCVLNHVNVPLASFGRSCLRFHHPHEPFVAQSVERQTFMPCKAAILGLRPTLKLAWYETSVRGQRYSQAVKRSPTGQLTRQS